MDNGQRFFKVLFMTFLVISLSFNALAQTKPLLNAHAHNDYKHQKPFFDAYNKGFNSIEVDIFLLKGELYVSHLRPILKLESKTLKSLYLEPLKDIVTENKSAYTNSKETLYLMIDIKTEANATYEILKKQLAEYAFMLTKYNGNIKEEGAVTIFLSGNRPVEQVFKEKEKFVAIDGRPSELGKRFSADFMPVVSTNFKNVCDWNGKGEIPNAEFEKLKAFTDSVHEEGKRARLWAIPDNENTWKVLLKAGIDLISTDKIEAFSAFIVQN